MSVPVSSTSNFPPAPPLSLPLDLPTETTAESHNDLFGDSLYYNTEYTNLESMDSMGLGHGLDSDMTAHMNMDLDLDLNLNLNTDVDLGQIMHMQDNNTLHTDYNEMSATTTAPMSLPTTTLASTTMTKTAFDKNIGQQPPIRHESASPPMFLFNEPNTRPSDTSPYGNPEDFAMNPKNTTGSIYDTCIAPLPRTTSSTYPGLFPLSLPQEPTPTTIFVRNNSPPLTRSRAHQSRNSHTFADVTVLDTILPSVEGHDGFGLDYSRGNSNSHSHSYSQSHGRRCSGSSNNSLDSMVDDEDMGIIDDNRRKQHQQPLTHPHNNINGPPPPDPSDWRARLRYCEQAVHKASLDASMVRLLDFPEGIDSYELEARRAANLRFDRVREQRLKDRNNEAAKRSRQRKVRRIEDAEQRIEALKQDRAYLSGRVAYLEKQLAAVAIGAGSSAAAASVSTGPVQQKSQCSVNKAYKVRGGGASGRCNSSKIQERRVSGGRAASHGPGSGSGRATRSRGNNNTGFQDDDDNDEEDGGDGNDAETRNGDTITVGITT
ncbi:hypothetical protein SBRCBS47491_004887 [Sporothrix bragantina]|uniref:BZIP domain-containing protein n=1 Tax=Sporothrix bragantina TaxID=671064 RepID=A0ABP0BSI6_9PEZI